jgi:small ligand-binding sensory domain FIST
MPLPLPTSLVVKNGSKIFGSTASGMPLPGFYGNGEIAHFDGANRLLQYSTVLALV